MKYPEYPQLSLYDSQVCCDVQTTSRLIDEATLLASQGSFRHLELALSELSLLMPHKEVWMCSRAVPTSCGLRYWCLRALNTHNPLDKASYLLRVYKDVVSKRQEEAPNRHD